ncbi:hypothetical protein GGI02_002945 [Coemansia sp. RSA 2322]|nr:hypothetical protein GGI02_002945 [Coemansia sp. RSA 2322]
MDAPHFPKPEDFATDARVKLVEETGCYKFLDPDDGMEYEYEPSKGAWFPMWNETLIEQQQSAYGAVRLAAEDAGPADASEYKRKGKEAHRRRENTSVYVSGLPLDTTESEVAEYFVQCGAIMPDIQTSTYFIAMAEFNDKEKPSAGPANAKRARFDAKLVQKRLGRLEKRLDWFEGDGEVPERHKRTVILAHMFTLDEMKADVTLVLDLAEDVRSECERLGPVSSVKVYDRSESGVVAVKFKNELAAKACIKADRGHDL